MADTLGKTLEIFLVTGEPRGIRTAELTTRIVQVILIPRSELAVAKKRLTIDQPAVYLLFGQAEDSAKPIVYIGQTENVWARLDAHNSKKDFWQTVVLGKSKTGSFTQAHIRYLEWYCIQKAKETNRFALDNDQFPDEPYVTEPMKADLLDSFDVISTLVSALGFPVFEPIVKAGSADVFYCKGKDADATGEMVEDGFVVRKNSMARLGVVNSAIDTLAPIRKSLIDGGVLVEQDGHLHFTQDYLFSSPSGAAAIVLGRSANGWGEWKDKDGRTLNEVKRGAVAEMAEVEE
jgi:hypothetical protein